MLDVPLRTVLQEYLTVRSLTFLGLGGDGHIGTGNLGVTAAGCNDPGGIAPQFMRIAVDGEVG